MNSKDTFHRAVIQHVILLVVLAAVLAVLYFSFQRGMWVGVIATLLVLGGAIYLLRGFAVNVFRRMHNLPNVDHAHTHDSLETNGLTIHWAGMYDVLVRMILLGGGEEKLRESIVKLAKIQPGASVLDVGCGTGTLAITAKRISPATVKVYGTDAAPEMIEKAREKAANAGLQVDFQPGLVEAIHFPDASLDVVLSSFMLHHLPGELKQRAFAEIYRVLKPGGRLLVVDFEPPKGGVSRHVLTFMLGQGMMMIDNTRVPPLLAAAGFVALESGNAGHKLATYISGQKPG